MKKLAVGLATIVLSAQAAAQQPDLHASLPSVNLPPDLDRVLRDYEHAWRAHDGQALSELFADDGFVMASGQPPVRGRAAIRAAYSGAGGDLALRAFAFSSGGGIGYIIGGFARSSQSADTGKFVLTLKRNGAGRWLIMSDMDNSNQQRPWPGPPDRPATSPQLTPAPLRERPF